MKNKSNLLIYSLIVTIGLFVYLTFHHYAVQLGTNTPGVCSINETLNCDAAAASSFSEIFQIPIALLGLFFNLVVLVLVLFKKLNWAENDEVQNGLIKLLFAFSALTSVALAVVSISVIKVGCPFCMATYVFSFINLYLVWGVFNPSNFHFPSIVAAKSTWMIGITIIALSWLTASGIQDNYGLKEVKRLLPEKVFIWKNAKVQNFASDLGLVQNPGAPHTLVEFADFKCPHCKVASNSLHSFMQGRKDIQFVFKAFPLDGVCNPHIQHKGDGSRCKMAAWTLCAEKIAKKGWDVHQWYFDNQDSLQPVSDFKETNTQVAQKFGLNYEEVETCSTSVTTLDEIKKMTDEGNAAMIGGTPALFLDGKKVDIRSDYFSMALKAILDSSK